MIASLLKPSGIWGSGLDTLLTALRQVIRHEHNNFPARSLGDVLRARGKTLAFDPEEIEELTDMRYGDKRIFPLLSLVFQHLDLRQHFHIDHIFPKSRFTPAKLIASGFPPEEADKLRDLSNRLPNLQLLEGHENEKKRAVLPREWLKTFDREERRESYVTTHLLGQVPEGLDGFEEFYEARRKHLNERIHALLAITS